jgi:hypothetical protein
MTRTEQIQRLALDHSASVLLPLFSKPCPAAPTTTPARPPSVPGLRAAARTGCG